MKTYLKNILITLLLAGASIFSAEAQINHVKVTTIGGSSTSYERLSSVTNWQDGDVAEILSSYTETKTVIINKNIKITTSGADTKTVTAGDSFTATSKSLIQISDGTTTIDGNIVFDANRLANSNAEKALRVADVLNGAKLILNCGTLKGGNLIGVGNSNDNCKGGGIYVHDGGEATLDGENAIIQNNYARYGGGVCNIGTFNLADGQIKENKARFNSDNDEGFPASGGGIYNTKTLVITGGSVSNNSIEFSSSHNHDASGSSYYPCGAGICIEGNSSTASITNAVISYNKNVYFPSNGGGIAVISGGSATVGTGTTISYNEAGRGAAVAISNNATLEMTGTPSSYINVSHNTSDENGGAIFSNDANSQTFKLAYVEFDTNKSSYQYGRGGAGGAIAIASCTSDSYIRNCVFKNNTAHWDGAAILVLDTGTSSTAPSFSMSDCSFTNNHCVQQMVGDVDRSKNAIWITATSNTHSPNIYVSGSIILNDDEYIYLDKKAVLTKAGSFDNAMEDTPANVLIASDGTTVGRDVLVKGASAPAVTGPGANTDWSKFNIMVANNYKHMFTGVYSPNGNDTNSGAVLELKGLAVIKITRAGLLQNESALYTFSIKKFDPATNGTSDAIKYTISLSGKDAGGSSVSKLIGDFFEPDTYTITEENWDWTYTEPSGNSPQSKACPAGQITEFIFGGAKNTSAEGAEHNKNNMFRGKRTIKTEDVNTSVNVTDPENISHILYW